MRAVNLIPEGERKGAGGAAGKSGGAAYVLIGALALLVVMAAAYALSGKSINDKKADLARVTKQADAAQAQAARLSAYTRFTDLRTKRVQTVSQLAQSRFDWAHALREVARVIPTNAWLVQLNGTVTPGVNTGGGTGAGGLRGSLPVPAVEISGCTTSQSSVAKVLARLRMIDGVQRVSLADSSKSDAGGGGAGGGGGGVTDCRAGSSHFPLFNAVVFFDAPAVAAASATGATGSAATASTTPGAGTAQPAASTSTTTTPSSTTTTPSTTTPTSTTPSSTTQPASGGSTP
jgi:Tfp pilus assembly protein PilN